MCVCVYIYIYMYIVCKNLFKKKNIKTIIMWSLDKQDTRSYELFLVNLCFELMAMERQFWWGESGKESKDVAL